MNVSEVKCNKCGCDIDHCAGYLGRVNPKGELLAVWECKPACSTVKILTQDEAVIAALEG